MKKIIILSGILLSAISICMGQHAASLHIISDIPDAIIIRGTIDGALQTSHPIDTLTVLPKKTILYKTDVLDYKCLQINLNAGRCFVWVFPGDSIFISQVEGRIVFKGSNAPGHKYYQNHWNGTMWFVNGLRNLIRTTDDYTDIEAKFTAEFINQTHKEIESLLPADSVTTRFIEILKRDIIDYQYSELYKALEQLQYNKTLTDDQIAQVNKTMNSINERFSNYDDYISLRFFLGSAYLDFKYQSLFKQLSKEEQKGLYGNYLPNTFGPYTFWLLAPKNMQVAKFFSAIMVDRQLGFTSMNALSLINYMRSIAPESESVAILTRLFKPQRMKENKEPIQYIKNEINSLADLSTIKDLAGNYALVDIWASWCIPCRQQFQYAGQLHKLASSYKNLKLVYLTIDEPSAEKEWKELVEKFKLTGFHLLANQKLREDISAQIFQQESITIPRYLLLSPSGEIICPDMPRPENLEKVEKILDQYLHLK